GPSPAPPTGPRRLGAGPGAVVADPTDRAGSADPAGSVDPTGDGEPLPDDLSDDAAGLPGSDLSGDVAGLQPGDDPYAGVPDDLRGGLGGLAGAGRHGEFDGAGRRPQAPREAWRELSRVVLAATDPAQPYGGPLAFDKFNPQWLSQQLMANAEYRQLFADRVQKFLVSAGGAMTPTAATAKFLELTNQINMAIIAESARWGDSKSSTPLGKNNPQPPRGPHSVRPPLRRSDDLGARRDHLVHARRHRSAPPGRRKGAGRPGVHRLHPTGPEPARDGPRPLGERLERPLGGDLRPRHDSAPAHHRDHVQPRLAGERPVHRRRLRVHRTSEHRHEFAEHFGLRLQQRNHFHLPDDGGPGGRATGRRGEEPDGVCHALPLVSRDTAQALALWDDKEGWRASASKNGNPGLADTGYNPGAVIINEVLAHTDMDAAPNYGDWIELKNTTAAAINIGGWFLSDDPLVLNKYRIADGTILPANGSGGYIAFTQFQHFGVGANAFALSELGDTVFLTAPAADGTPGGYRESQSFGASDREFSIGLYTKSTGGTDFVELASKTRGAANSLPLVGGFHINQTEVYAGDLVNPGVVINEIMYNPATIDGDEFIELRNLSASAVKLYDPLHPENRWKFTEGIAPDGVPFVLPAGAEIPAYGYALVVAIDPATFRTKYGIAASVPIFGPYAPGVLSNAGDSIELQKPGTPETDGTVPYYRVDRVTYNDKSPWPVRADGDGSSLIRLNSANYGNDVANWGAGTTGGTPGAENRGLDTTPPSSPGSVTATVAGASQIDISWVAATDPESGIGVYRVYRNNIPVAECTTTLYHDTNAQPAITYTYQVAAVNRDGVEGAKSTSVTARIIALVSAAAANIVTVQAVFSEAVTQASAQNLGNYAITYPTNQQASILGAVL
ncbi:MAG: lamin tail domain-containing protein, partial [Planctomycetota bacterium]|nr:lamin tail domain-containing protein [Planctomycetota bacterium]